MGSRKTLLVVGPDGKVAAPGSVEDKLALAREALEQIAKIDDWDQTLVEASWHGRLGGEASTPRTRLRQCGKLANAALRFTA